MSWNVVDEDKEWQRLQNSLTPIISTNAKFGSKIMSDKTKAIILLSGGIDSAVVLAKALEQDRDVFPLFFNYGQPTVDKELRCAARQTADFVSRGVTGVIWGVPEVKCDPDTFISQENRDSDSMFIPYRNLLFHTYAAMYAHSVGATEIWNGATADDQAGYPDCGRYFFDSLETTFWAATDKPGPGIIAPIIKLTKVEVIREALRLNVPLELTWSCYRNNNVPCGECDSCKLRADSFKELNMGDPILNTEKE